MSPAAEAPPSLLSDADRAKRLDSVDAMIYQLIRRHGLAAAEVEDAAQECRLTLWRVSGTFDPTGRARWSTFAQHVIRNVLKQERERILKAAMPGGLPLLEYDDERAPDRDADDRHDDEPDDDEQAGQLLAAVRRQAVAAAVAGLSPTARQVVTLIVADGLTAARAAARLGVEPKMVALLLRRALGQMAKAGHLPAGLAERFGFNPRDLADGSDRAATLANCAARRQLVAEAAGLGLTPAAITAGLGVPLGTVNTDLATLRKKAGTARRSAGAG